jgi:hypothetical protein
MILLWNPCVQVQTNKEGNKLTRAARKEIPTPLVVASIGDTQHVRVCCRGNVERGEEEKCAASLRLWTMLQRLALQSITDKTSPTHTLNTKQNQGGLSNKSDFD